MPKYGGKKSTEKSTRKSTQKSTTHRAKASAAHGAKRERRPQGSPGVTGDDHNASEPENNNKHALPRPGILGAAGSPRKCGGFFSLYFLQSILDCILVLGPNHWVVIGYIARRISPLASVSAPSERIKPFWCDPLASVSAR